MEWTLPELLGSQISQQECVRPIRVSKPLPQDKFYEVTLGVNGRENVSSKWLKKYEKTSPKQNKAVLGGSD